MQSAEIVFDAGWRKVLGRREVDWNLRPRRSVGKRRGSRDVLRARAQENCEGEADVHGATLHRLASERAKMIGCDRERSASPWLSDLGVLDLHSCSVRGAVTKAAMDITDYNAGK